MFGNLSIRSKLLGLLAVPVAAAVLLGVTGVTAASGDRNGVAVRLGRSPAGGVTATVRVPSGLLTAPAPVVARRG